MRICVLTHRLDDPSFRVRWRQFFGAFVEAGFEVSAHAIPRSSRERRAILEAAADADVCVLHRRLLRAPVLRKLRRRARRLVYDFDDALLYRPVAPHRSKGRARRFWNTVAAADLVLAGNRYLAQIARLKARRVAVVPTTVDTEALRPSREKDAGFVAVWIGQRATLPHLEAVRATLLEAGRSIDGFRLRVVADAAPAGAEWVPWSLDAEGPAVARAHVGLMPLPRDPFARGKCGYKLLQYYAAGLPAIASPVGVNRALAAGGALLSHPPGEWADALEALARDPVRRAELGRKGRSFVERRYSAALLAPRLVALLKSVTNHAVVD